MDPAKEPGLHVKLPLYNTRGEIVGYVRITAHVRGGNIVALSNTGIFEESNNG